jgi:hypothetical protein
MDELIALLMRPTDYVCAWRHGELYIEAAPETARGDEGRREAASTDKIAA